VKKSEQQPSGTFLSSSSPQAVFFHLAVLFCSTLLRTFPDRLLPTCFQRKIICASAFASGWSAAQCSLFAALAIADNGTAAMPAGNWFAANSDATLTIS
jgi:hypothetical protein